MTDRKRQTTMGSRTRPLLEQAKIDKNYLDGIEAGLYTWTIEAHVHSPGSHTLKVAEQLAREGAGKDPGYKIVIYPTEANSEKWEEFGEDGVAVSHASRQLGQQIIWARDQDAE